MLHIRFGLSTSLRAQRSNPSHSAKKVWIAHMGKWGVKARCTSLFDCSHLSVPTAGTIRWRAQIESRPPRRGAAKRLGLDAIEHAIRLLWSGRKWAGAPVVCDPRFEPVYRSGCMPDQTHIRSSHEATAPTFRLRRAGSRGRGHSSLRLFKAMQSIGSSTRIGRG
jgi:hypothetical protein